jgi:hypothetical protein
MTACLPLLTVMNEQGAQFAKTEEIMPKYLIERTIAGVGQMEGDGLAAIASDSNKVLRDLGPDIQWVHSYVVDDKSYCLYLAESEEIVREHGRRGGFPIDAVYEVHSVIDPTTAELIR